MGLKIPESHIYKKFNIPKPEDGERVLEPAVKPSVQDEGESFKMESFKQDYDEVQGHLDGMAEESIKHAEGIFHEMVKPLVNIVDKTDDLETLRQTLKDEKKVNELYSQMESPELEDILHQSMYLAELIGRSAEE